MGKRLRVNFFDNAWRDRGQSSEPPTSKSKKQVTSFDAEALGPSWKREWQVTEGWVTIHGNHVLIGQEVSSSAKAAESHLKNTKISSSDRLGGKHSSEVLKVEFADGTKAVFKPGDGEVPGGRADVSDGFQTEREVAAWEVAKLVGMDDLVTPVVATEMNGHKGALLAWRDGEVAAHFTDEIAYDGEKDLQRAAAFDFVIGNEDRHAKNWMVANNKLELIDHGLGFPDKGDKGEGNRYFMARVYSEMRDSEIKAEFKNPFVKGKQEILTSLIKSGLPSGSVEGVSKRIDALSQAKTWQDVTGAYFSREED